MKKLEIIIRPSKLEDVKEALSKVGIHGMTISDVRGFGRQGGYTQVYRGADSNVKFLPKIKLEIVVQDDGLKEILHAVMDSARTGELGDGKIFILPVDDAIRIRTGENYLAAL